MSDELEKRLQELTDLDAKILELAKEMLQGDHFPLDYLAGAVMNRTLSLIDGYITLTRGENFLAAAHLIRPNLDNYLRFHAAWLVSDPHDFAGRIMSGEHVRKMKDKTGAKMTDAYLVSTLKDEHDWLERVYEETSGFVHLSRQHVISSLRYIERDGGVIEGAISRKDGLIPDEWKIEATRIMILVTKLTGRLVNSWTWTKKNSGKTPDVE